MFAHIAVLATFFGSVSGLGMGLVSLYKKGLSNSVVEMLIMGIISALHV